MIAWIRTQDRMRRFKGTRRIITDMLPKFGSECNYDLLIELT
jgi:hypothetical protein